ncbi:MAG: ATP-binding protein [Candidatus Abyssobacteria bacterium SURF_17]|uniref:ATP-binding protein n=1 Tax=Candidatus Abyssobacteria bacterium SURF_17 TaxID=2093361 RepID=A0A419ESA0_9BACT|nr:MAG: ATP-binding protein [Candidatus Abyssubacteria bacterium SURF_17]
MSNNRNQDVAVVGSPSTNTELTLDLLQEATEERLVGALSAFQATQNGQEIVSVGQIVGIELKNRWHEDSVFRNLVKRTGEIPPITNRQDTRTADLVVGATFKKTPNGFQPEVLGMVPATGTRVSRIDQKLLDQLLQAYSSEIFYLGQAYANEILYPMWFKHFGSNDQGPGGAGEAYHIGVFGKTGSGKSGLAKMMLCAYARHPHLGILLIDPQGEFSDELNGVRRGHQGLPLDTVVTNLGRPIQRYRIVDLQLDTWDLLEELLVVRRFVQDQLDVRGAENVPLAAEYIREGLQRSGITLSQLSSENALRTALNIVSQRANRIYTSQARADQLRDRTNTILTSEFDVTFQNGWLPIADLFRSGQGRRTLFGIVRDLIQSGSSNQPRPVVVIDISEEGNPGLWAEEIERRVMTRLLNVLIIQSAQRSRRQESANVLVMIDEAARHAPAGRINGGSEAEVLRTVLRNAVRETRKYGLGWLFISQTLGGLDNEILQQLRILAFGFGLAMGTEFDRLREFVSGDKRSLELYRSFRDPQSFPARELQEFPFMAVGPVSPLAFSGKPIFFSMFTDMNRFLQANHIS